MDEPVLPQTASIEERKLALEHERLRLDRSFARQWFPTLATTVVALSVAVFGYVQSRAADAATDRARVEASNKDEREWGFKVVEMYFKQRELFDVTKSPDQALANLRVLVAVAPKAVQGVISAEQERLPAPGGDDAQQQARLNGLAVVADIQSAIAQRKDQAAAASAQPAIGPSSIVVYLQYPEGARDAALTAQTKLRALGYRSPGLEQVRNVPSRLQVRYYRTNQKELAAGLVIKMGEALGLPASADNAILVKSDKPLPDGIMEVWLPRAGAAS